MAAISLGNTHGTSRLLKTIFLCAIMLLPSISASADFRTLKTGDTARQVRLPTTQGEVQLPAPGTWQFIVTVGARGRQSEGVAEVLPELVTKLGNAPWKPVIVVADAAPQSELGFTPPGGITLAFDSDRAWYEALGLFVFPAAGLFDPDGVLRWQRSGFSRDWSDVVEDTLRHYLGLPPREGADTSAPTLNREAERLYRLGISFVKDHRLAEARQALDSALAMDPRFALAHLERADLYRLLGDETGAEAEYEAALASDSTLARAWTGLAESALAQNHLDRALECTERALQLNPRSIVTSQLQARVYIEQDNYPKAEEILAQLVKLEPTNPEVRYHLGRVFEATGRNDKALESYREALRLILDQSTP